MMAPDIQNVFRHRHILVLGVDTAEMKFDLKGLGSVGSLTQCRQMQGENDETCYLSISRMLVFQFWTFEQLGTPTFLLNLEH